MTEPSDRAHRALRRASLRQSGRCVDNAQTQAAKGANDPTTKENRKAVAHARFAPPLAPSSNRLTTATSTTDSTNDRKRPASNTELPLNAPPSLSTSSAPTYTAVSRNTRSKKQRSVKLPPAPIQRKGQAPQDYADSDAAYRLKSAVGGATAAASAAATATVTPAVPRRQILFQNETKITEKEEQQSNNSTNMAALPDGVIDIYPPRAMSRSCNCVAEICLEQRAGFLHSANYGVEWQAYLREKETREYPMVSSSSASLCALTGCASPFGNGGKDELSVDQADSPDSTASKSSLASSLSSSSTTASPSTRTPGSLLRFDVRASKDTPRFLEESTGHLKRQPYITGRMRAVLVSWLVEVATEYDISDQAFHLAITLLDIMLAKGPTDLEAWEEKSRRRRLRPANHDDDDSCSDDSGDSTTTEPDYFVVQRAAFQAFGWYVQYTIFV
jgi:hypothetical protein